MKMRVFLIGLLALVGGVVHAEEEDFANQCTLRGGACVAVYPGACSHGRVSHDSCGGGLGVQCCLPTTGGSNQCVQNGGTCVALVPGACSGGYTSNYSCGGGLGVTCCFR